MFIVSNAQDVQGRGCRTHGSITAGFRTTTLESDAVALVLQALRSDEALDARGLGVRFGTLLLGLDFTTNDEFADLRHYNVSMRHSGRLRLSPVVL